DDPAVARQDCATMNHLIAIEGRGLLRLIGVIVIVGHAGDQRPDPPGLLQKPDQAVPRLVQCPVRSCKNDRAGRRPAAFPLAIMRPCGARQEWAAESKKTVRGETPPSKGGVSKRTDHGPRCGAYAVRTSHATRACARPPVLPSVAIYPSRAPPGRA